MCFVFSIQCANIHVNARCSWVYKFSLLFGVGRCTRGQGLHSTSFRGSFPSTVTFPIATGTAARPGDSVDDVDLDAVARPGECWRRGSIELTTGCFGSIEVHSVSSLK